MIDAPDPRPLLTLLVGDPLVSDDGQPLGSTWRSPWGRLADDLAAAVRRTGVGLWLDVQPATWGRAVECLPRSRFVALLCHGSPQTLSFEADAGARRRVLSVADDLPRLFQGHLPEVVLVLACQGAAAAAAIHAAGVPFTLGIDEQHMLPWDEAVKLGATFFGALGAGQPLSVAAAQAAGATQHAPLFRAFGTGSLSSALPQGDVTTQDLAPWVLRPAKETFVGRERELAALLDELARPGACVQISGPPGIGKSELTRALLERARLLRWPSAGSLFVVLERARSAADVLNAVRLALGPLGLEAPSARQIGQKSACSCGYEGTSSVTCMGRCDEVQGTCVSMCGGNRY